MYIFGNRDISQQKAFTHSCHERNSHVAKVPNVKAIVPELMLDIRIPFSVKIKSYR